MVTISCIKADVGSYAGHVIVPEEMLEIVRKTLKNGKKQKTIKDFYVFHVGDDINTVMLHNKGSDDNKVHELAWTAFEKAASFAKKNKLYGAGQDLLSDAFSGNVRGLGPGIAEITFNPRKSDPIGVFASDKTEPSAFSLPLFKIFADPLSNSGLIIDPSMIKGFVFDVVDIYKNEIVSLKCPEEMYYLLSLIGTTSTFNIKRVYKNSDETMEDKIAAVVSTEKLSSIAGKYVGKDDPVCVIRAQSGFPAMGEITEGFATGHLVSGWMRGSHRGPLMPVSIEDSHPSRFDGPPRVVGLGFNVTEKKLFGPRDLFKDVAFDSVRQSCLEIVDYMRSHGPFEPHRLGEKEMEYTTIPQIIQKLRKRFKKIGGKISESNNSSSRVRDTTVSSDKKVSKSPHPDWE